LSELDLVATKFGFIDQGVLLREMSHGELHKLTQKSLIIEVNDTNKAVELLETELKTKKYSVDKNKEIILEDYLQEPHKVSKLLVENGLELYTIKRQETTLEQYFINLIAEKND
jgi:ABC-2 type transport system ATP-binding protein